MRLWLHSLAWATASLLLCALGYTLYVEAGGPAAQKPARARGCFLCHDLSAPLPGLRHWEPGSPMHAPLQKRLQTVHPLLSRGAEAELTELVANMQLPALMHQRAGTLGKNIFMAKCAVCHGKDGKGAPGEYPPLRDSEWLIEEPGRLPEILTHGLHGPISVKGEAWDKDMRSPGLSSPEEMEEVIRYLRGEFAPKEP